ncbi:MAG: hypothetical protein QW356_06890 [Candidatus Hadarchaeales archaeon]
MNEKTEEKKEKEEKKEEKETEKDIKLLIFKKPAKIFTLLLQDKKWCISDFIKRIKPNLHIYYENNKTI